MVKELIKQSAIILSMLLLIFVIGCTERNGSEFLRSSEIEKKTSDFPPIIEIKIREALADTESPLSDEDLKKIESINLEGISDPIDLSSLTRLENLESIHLSHVKVMSYDFIYNMQHLSSLHLEGVSLKELPDFSKIHLQSLTITDSDIETLDFISNWDSLVTLELSSSQLTTLEGIQNAKKLKNLLISYNPVSDISQIKELINLERIELKSTQVQDITILQEQQNLKLLDIRDTSVDTVSFLANLPELKILLVTKDNIKDLDHIGDSVQVSETNILAY
ncbi:leucine-rich repeat domain-containing protein [Paenibacillus apis]|uniref:Leucine-rich repeat domain-containing protein n=1 Tax=Paenibacillus apis TaxID=1792174 RepID=A0A919Y4Z2_9BACL|nr:hypothetical protein [Paenibacillus apis]GIO44206.1 hypothetical protein J41TS4_39640 [Paenibacillus apis]